MKHRWPFKQLGEVLKERNEEPLPDDLYSGRVRIVEKISFNSGQIQLRTDGSTKTNMILIQPGDLVVSGINAAKGAIAIYDKLAAAPVAATIHYGAYIADQKRVNIRFLWWMLRSRFFQELLHEYVPGGIKTELKAKRFLPVPVPLPPLAEQQRIVTWIEELSAQIHKARNLGKDIEAENTALLMSAYRKISRDSKRLPMNEVAPLNRRPVAVDIEKSYPGVSVRSFGRGTFHNPPLAGSEVTWQKPFLVKSGDILISNIKAWEGAIAVATQADDGRVGSHRYLTCVPLHNVATSRYVCFHLLTPEGLYQVGEASPGSADRNRTLNTKALLRIPIPVPPIEKQLWFDQLYDQVDMLKGLQNQTATELEALLPSILDRAFKGELLS